MIYIVMCLQNLMCWKLLRNWNQTVYEDGLLLSENFIKGSDLLFVYVSLLFTVMLSHSFAPPDFVIWGIMPIHEGPRVALTESENYRSIATSSILSKILDNIIIDNQVHSLVHQIINLALSRTHLRCCILQWWMRQFNTIIRMEINLYIFYCWMHQRRLIKYPFTLCLICY